MSPRRLTRRWRLLAGVARLLRWAFRWRVRVHGLSHVPASGGAVLAFNHHSYVDFVLVAWPVVLDLDRPVRFLGKREIWASRVLGWLPRWVEAIPVDRASSQGRSDAFRRAVDALASGDLVALAPEQTISASFDLLPFRSGAVRMAQQAAVPVVPVVGWGSQRFASPGIRMRPRFGLPVEVRFGAPIEVPSDADPQRCTEQLRECMADMLDELQRSYPDGTPQGAPWVPARLGGGAPDHAEIVERLRMRTRSWRQADTPERDPDPGGGEAGPR